MTPTQKETVAFWRNLGEGMKKFDETKNLPAVGVSNDGFYTFN
jgi:hypothetical protein